MSSEEPEGKKKRVSLKVVQDKPRTLLEQAELGSEDREGSDGRSPWAWVLLGAMACFVMLVPLSMVGMVVVKKLSSDVPRWPPLLLISIMCLSISCFWSGYLVGRFGGKAGPREGAMSGAVAGLVMWLLTVTTSRGMGGGRSLLGLVILLLTVPVSWAGARTGRRSRKATD